MTQELYFKGAKAWVPEFGEKVPPMGRFKDYNELAEVVHDLATEMGLSFEEKVAIVRRSARDRKQDGRFAFFMLEKVLADKPDEVPEEFEEELEEITIEVVGSNLRYFAQHVDFAKFDYRSRGYDGILANWYLPSLKLSGSIDERKEARAYVLIEGGNYMEAYHAFEDMWGRFNPRVKHEKQRFYFRMRALCLNAYRIKDGWPPYKESKREAEVRKLPLVERAVYDYFDSVIKEDKTILEVVPPGKAHE